MKIKTTAEIRQAFLDYFKAQGHDIVAGGSLIPNNDPTLLFTNAGMVQFKDVFLGNDKRSYSRAASVQRCVRAGGKHNDLDNVGYTARHHTFFEMLGNFSFGDYFKKQAIEYAWEFLTKTLKLPPEKLWVTVYKDDSEAADIWLKHMKVDAKRFSYCGEADNFWSMGETGPCGPCTEIFYDHGENIAGGPPGSAEQDGDRYTEIWNLVFMQYNRDAKGQLTKLPKPSVDTGMGLERVAAVVQGVHSNYDIDLFHALIKAIASIAGTQDLQSPSLKVIADHIRACAFLITDGVLPSNEGRGYVLRRIIRRAVYHGHYRLGIKQAFFYKLLKTLVKEMGGAYPELVSNQQLIEQTLQGEEKQFLITLDKGLKILQQWIIEHPQQKQIPGEFVFKLYDTFGMPVDVTEAAADDCHCSIDASGFEKAMTEQKQRSKQASQFGSEYTAQLAEVGNTTFTGYDTINDKATITTLLSEGSSVQQLPQGEKGVVVLDNTPFYAESGGQVGDVGILKTSNAVFVVEDTQKRGAIIMHQGYMKKGAFTTGQQVSAEVDLPKRQATALNHSATHLLNAALHQVLGKHVQQKGSLVAPGRLRFDFSQPHPVSQDQLNAIEKIVNDQIRANNPVTTELMALEQAKKSGAVALFGEKYDEKVRVLSMGEFSKELCGGTHVKRTGDIGLFKIIQETSIAAGIRRIDAITGDTAMNWVNQQAQQLQQLGQLLNAKPDILVDKVQQLISTNRELNASVQQLQSKLAHVASADLLGEAREIDGIKIIVTELQGANAKSLRDTLDQLKSKLDKAIILLASVENSKVSLVAGVTDNCTDKVKANELVNKVASQLGGKGGGRADMAQAGATQAENLDEALQSVMPWIEQQLQ